MSEWQDISTAPEGAEIIGFGQIAGEISGHAIRPLAASIVWAGKTDYPGFNWYVLSSDGYAVWMKPTKWMPLPTEEPAP